MTQNPPAESRDRAASSHSQSRAHARILKERRIFYLSTSKKSEQTLQCWNMPLQKLRYRLFDRHGWSPSGPLSPPHWPGSSPVDPALCTVDTAKNIFI